MPIIILIIIIVIIITGLHHFTLGQRPPPRISIRLCSVASVSNFDANLPKTLISSRHLLAAFFLGFLISFTFRCVALLSVCCPLLYICFLTVASSCFTSNVENVSVPTKVSQADPQPRWSVWVGENTRLPTLPPWSHPFVEGKIYRQRKVVQEITREKNEIMTMLVNYKHKGKILRKGTLRQNLGVKDYQEEKGS